MSGSLEDIPWLLVTGQGRSGTTALTRAIAAHSQVCSNRVESNVMKDILLAGHASSTVESRVRQMVLDRESHDREFRRMLVRLLFPERLWTGHDKPKRLSTFSAMSPDAADFAVAALPGIHFANIVRNGIEVVASRMVHRVMGSQPFEAHCEAWAAAVEMARWGESRSAFSLIRHENLVQESTCRGAISGLLTRAELSDDPAVADFLLSEKRNQTRWADEDEASAASLQQRVERWRLWSDRQRELFREICGAAMNYFGYVIPWQHSV
jgi:Sulfotransferase family